MAATAISQPRTTLWQSLKEAMRGTRQDFTEGSISRAILSACNADGARDVDGIAVRDRQRVLGNSPWREMPSQLSD